MNEWTVMRFREVADLFDGPHATPKPATAGPCFLGIKSITSDGKIDNTSIRHISWEEYPKWTKRVTPSKGDIVFSYEATLHQYCMIPDGFIGCLGRRMALLRINSAKANGVFVYHYLRSDKWRAYIEQKIIHGSTVDRISIQDFPNYEIELPNRLVQDRIVSIIDNYDNLIENNNRRIAILEEMAQKLYREWFVHFRFPGHENVKMVESEIGLIPEGWDIGKLSNIADNHKKGVKKDNRENYQCYIPIDCIPKKSLALSETKSIDEAESSLIEFRKNDILMGAMRAYFHKVICAPCGGLTRSTCFVIRPKDEIYHAYLLMTIFQDQSIEYANTVSVGATMPYVNWDTFAQMQTLIPSSDVALMYNDALKPITQQIHNIFYKNTTLRKTRDLLLPHLISGDIDVSELDIPIKEG